VQTSAGYPRRLKSTVMPENWFDVLPTRSIASRNGVGSSATLPPVAKRAGHRLDDGLVPLDART